MTDTFEAPRFAVEVDRRGPVVVLALSGELDISTTPEFEQAIADLEPGYAKLVIDLSGCNFFASSGISILLEQNARGQREGFQLVIVKGPPIVQRIFDLTSLDGTLTFQDRAEAEAAP